MDNVATSMNKSDGIGTELIQLAASEAHKYWGRGFLLMIIAYTKWIDEIK